METKDLESKEEKIKKLIQHKLDETRMAWIELEPVKKDLPDKEYMKAVDEYVKTVNKHMDKIDVLKELLKEIETI